MGEYASFHGTLVGVLSLSWQNRLLLYPRMLLVDALASLLNTEDTSVVAGLLDEQAQTRIFITIFQACFRTLLEHADDGSWGGCWEETCYGLLILTKARHIAIFNDLGHELRTAIDGATRYILSAKIDARNHTNNIWHGKTGYSSPLLAEAYRIAALKTASLPAHADCCLGARLSGKTVFVRSLEKYLYILRRTLLFANWDQWKLRGSAIEAALFQPLLRSYRLAVFPRTRMEEDKSFDIIPLTWLSCNNRSLVFASSSFLLEMMKISVLNYQVDEHMETMAGPDFAADLSDLRRTIDALFSTSIDNNSVLPLALTQNGAKSEAIGPLHEYVRRVLHHPAIIHASKTDRRVLAAELRTFLQAHVTQHGDSIRLRSQMQSDQVEEPMGTFFSWVRTTSADHTSCPYSFAYVSCLLSSSLMAGEECFPTTAQKYFAKDACQHLASMCRMYNDYGSVQCDKAEGNLNSINLPEFAARTVDPDRRKAELFELAEYERACLKSAISRLQKSAPNVKRKMQVLELFSDVTDLYGQIYMVKDIASRAKLRA